MIPCKVSTFFRLSHTTQFTFVKNILQMPLRGVAPGHGAQGGGLPVDYKVEIAGNRVYVQGRVHVPVANATVADENRELTGIAAGNTVEITDKSEILREGNGNAAGSRIYIHIIRSIPG